MLVTWLAKRACLLGIFAYGTPLKNFHLSETEAKSFLKPRILPHFEKKNSVEINRILLSRQARRERRAKRDAARSDDIVDNSVYDNAIDGDNNLQEEVYLT